MVSDWRMRLRHINIRRNKNKKAPPNLPKGEEQAMGWRKERKETVAYSVPPPLGEVRRGLERQKPLNPLKGTYLRRTDRLY